MAQSSRLTVSAYHYFIQRVIASTGYISPRGDNGTGAERQMERLTEEGVEVTDMGGNGVTINGRGGRYRVSLAQYGWFPESLAT